MTKQPKPRRKSINGQPLTEDDPLFRSIGSARSGIPGGISGRKHEYQLKAYRYHLAMAANDRITTNPRVMTGKPVVKGTRIPVERVLAHLADNPNLIDLFAAFS